jgi:ubiquinone/menaquinone biosynthesis C-methylase UbiE
LNIEKKDGIVTPRDWEKIYKEKGDLGYEVLPRIRKASALFKTKNYHNVLDLGCGTGRHSIFLAKQGFQVYATDMSPTALKIAGEKAAALGLRNVHLEQHDMKSIPFIDNFFDAVICTWALHHGTLAQIQGTISEVHRVLAPGGTFVTDMPSTTTAGSKNGIEIEKNTLIGKKSEEDVPHHYSTREEIRVLFSRFQSLDVRLHTATEYYRANKVHSDSKEGIKYTSKRYYINAAK